MDQGLLAGLLSSTIEIAAPLFLVASIELLVQRSGMINLAVEGAMLLGAFSAYLAALYSGNPLIGVLLGVFSGIIISGVLAILATNMRLDQMVSGLSISIITIGLTAYLYRLFIGAGKPPQLTTTLGDLGLLSIATFAMPLAIWLLLNRSRLGVLIRASGEDPERACRLGVRVSILRLYLLLIEGSLAGLSGALLSIGFSGLYMDNMTAGRGYIAVVLVILSGWDPMKLLPAILAFSLLDAIQLRMQASGMIQIPYQLALAMPYIAAIIALAIAGKGLRAPKSLATHESPC
ncbi:MAG TPA: ABC transporter permease [Sulfolobales archaeon]|nr:ABC transporter permease [Sulfolobales archaeon]